MSFCLPKEFTDKFRQALVDGTIKPAELADMTSAERNDFFSKIVGKENAADVNALFESKLLLKNQQAGLITWAKKVAGLTEPARTDLISRIERMDKVLDPEDENGFLADLAAQKLGTGVTFDEVKNVTQLTRAASNARTNWDSDKAEIDLGKDARNKNAGWKDEDERLDYGSKYVALQNYIKELKGSDDTFLQRAKERGVSGAGQTTMDAISTIGGIAKGVMASFDDSFLGRQGFKTMFTHPVEWAKSAAGSFDIIAKTLMEKEKGSGVMGYFKTPAGAVLDAVKADIYSRPNAMNGLYDKAKLDIGNSEEAYPESGVEKVPFLGRLFKASEVAFEGTAYRLRADVFDRYAGIASKGGIDMTDTYQVRSIGKLVNSLTGRGDLGPLEKVGKVANNLFFSPKFLKSNIDFLTSHLTDDTSAFAKKQAAINLSRVLVGTATILTIAKAISPNSVNLDPRSSDFGKIKIGDTRIDVSGGMAPFITLASKLVPTEHNGKWGWWKQSTTGKWSQLNTGKFGSETSLDQFNDFLWNRTAPVGGVLKDLLTQEDQNYQRPTVVGELKNATEPFVAQNIEQLTSDPDAAPWWAAEILDGLGFSQNTFSSTPKK